MKNNYIKLFVALLNPKDACKYRKFEKPKMSCTFDNTLVLSIICSKC